MATQPLKKAMSTNIYANALQWGGWYWGDPSAPAGAASVVKYYLNNDLYGPWGGAMRAWTDKEAATMASAFQTWSNVAKITFQRTMDKSQAQMIENLSSNRLMPDGILGEHGTPETAHDGGYDGMRVVGRNNQAYGHYAYEQFAVNGLNPGGYDFVTLVHEIGHGIGLAHPHDNGGGSEVIPGVTPGDTDDTGTYDLNQGIFTIMSYNDGWETVQNPVGHGLTTFGYASGPMAFDIAAVQALYGANMAYHRGNDVYTLPDANKVGTSWSCIWDAGGIDTMRYTGSRATTIDLTAATLDSSAKAGGVPSYATGIYGGFTIANGVVIENASGGLGADKITGNSAANVLTGNGGADTICGVSGNDQIYGNAGKDILDGGFGKDTLTGGTEADTFRFSTAAGSSNVDRIVDFTSGIDKIQIDNAVFTAFTTEGVVSAGSLVLGTAAVDANDYLIFNAATGILSYDADASGAGIALQLAQLSGVTTLSASSLWII